MHQQPQGDRPGPFPTQRAERGPAPSTRAATSSGLVVSSAAALASSSRAANSRMTQQEPAGPRLRPLAARSRQVCSPSCTEARCILSLARLAPGHPTRKQRSIQAGPEPARLSTPARSGLGSRALHHAENIATHLQGRLAAFVLSWLPPSHTSRCGSASPAFARVRKEVGAKKSVEGRLAAPVPAWRASDRATGVRVPLLVCAACTPPFVSLSICGPSPGEITSS